MLALRNRDFDAIVAQPIAATVVVSEAVRPVAAGGRSGKLAPPTNRCQEMQRDFAMKRYAFDRLAASTAGGLLLALASISIPAAAQGINPEQACKDDAFRFCNEFIPDRDRVGACLRAHARSLSRDCRTLVTGGGGERGRATHRTSRHHRTKHHHD